MRYRQLPLIVASVIAFGIDARADECLDASERARTELQGRRLLTARAHLRNCAASTCEETIRTVCEERLTEIAQRLASIVFDVKGDDGNDVPDVTLVVDGVPANEHAGAEIMLDPGPHRFSFEWRERVETRTYVLLEREKGRRETVSFARPAGASKLTSEPAPMEARTERVGGPWRTVSVIGMAAGAVGMGIGTAFGIVAIGKNSDAGCDANNLCSDPRSRHDARISANISTGAFVTGGILAAAGLVLFFFGPKH